MNREELMRVLCADLPRVIAVIGGGGKTTTLYTLGEALAGMGRSVLLTTTTHIGITPFAVVPNSAEELNRTLAKGKAVLAGVPIDDHKMNGIPQQWYPLLQVDHIIVEADGSRNLPLKVHRETEPVVPQGTQLLLQLAGLSALDRPVGETVHRYELLGLLPEQPVDEALAARLLVRGLAASGYTGRSLVLLNQADTPELERRAQRIAQLLRTQGITALPVHLKDC